jgi:hypothetical protein
LEKSVEINRVNGVVDPTDPDTRVVDFGADSPGGTLSVVTGSGTTLDLDMGGDEGQLARLRGDLSLTVADFFHVEGGLAFERSSGQVTLDDTNVVNVDFLTVGAEGVDAFSGLNGCTADALGLALADVDFGLALMTDKADGARKWASLVGDAGSVTLTGIDGLEISGDTISLEINRAAADGTIVDYAAQPLDIVTGSGTLISLEMASGEGELLRVSGNLTLDVFGFLTVTGGLAFEK